MSHECSKVSTTIGRLEIKIVCNLEPFECAVRALSVLAKHSPKDVKRFLRGGDSSAELVRIECIGRAATWTNDLLVVIRPSARLADFLTAVETRHA